MRLLTLCVNMCLLTLPIAGVVTARTLPPTGPLLPLSSRARWNWVPSMPPSTRSWLAAMASKASPPSSSSPRAGRTGTVPRTTMEEGLAAISYSGPPTSGRRTYHLPRSTRYILWNRLSISRNSVLPNLSWKIASWGYKWSKFWLTSIPMRLIIFLQGFQNVGGTSFDNVHWSFNYNIAGYNPS